MTAPVTLVRRLPRRPAWRRVMTYLRLESAYPGLRPALLNNGAGMLLRLYWAADGRDDLGNAVEALHAAVALTPAQSPLLPGRLGNLGLARREVYRNTGDRSVLEQAIDAFERAARVNATPTMLTNLALGLQDRYLLSSDPDDLAWAIDCSEQASRDAEPGASQVMLGDLLRLRYKSWLRVTQTMPARTGRAFARAGGPHMAALVMEELLPASGRLVQDDMRGGFGTAAGGPRPTNASPRRTRSQR